MWRDRECAWREREVEIECVCVQNDRKVFISRECRERESVCMCMSEET